MKPFIKKKLTIRQKKKLKKIAISILIFYFLCTLGTFYVLFDTFKEKPKPSDCFYVNDYSGVLSDEAEEYLCQQCQELDNKQIAQIAIVTIPDTGKESLEKYSLDLANKWKIGQKISNKGVLILFTTKEAHVRLEVGYGLEGYLTNYECGQILDDNAVEEMYYGNWNQASINTLKAVACELYNHSFLTTPSLLQSKTTMSSYAEKNTMADATLPKFPILRKIATSLIIALFLTFVPLGLSINRKKPVKSDREDNKGNTYSGDIYQNIDRNSVDDFISFWDNLGDSIGGSGDSSGGGGGGGGFGGGGASR